MLWLTLNWKWLLSAVASGLSVAGLAWMLHTFDVNRINAKHEKALTAQASRLYTVCENDKQLTKEVSHDYQTKVSDLTARLAAKHVSDKRCIPLSTGAAAGRDAAPSVPGYDSGNGLTANALFGYAGKCEEIGLRLDACQAFVRQVWESKKAREK